MYIEQYQRDVERLMQSVNWSALRRAFGADLISQGDLERLINNRLPPDDNTAFFFQVIVVGSARFYRAQTSLALERLTDPDRRARRKQEIINGMRRSARESGSQFNWGWEFRDGTAP